MKWLLILLLICLPVLSQAQYTLWEGVASAGKDTVIMISAAADSVISRWISYNDWKEFEGGASLWTAAYSYSDGLGVHVKVKYQTRVPDDNKSGSRLSFWTVLDSVKVSQDTQIRYGTGDQVGVQFDVANRGDPWAAHEQIRFMYHWAPSSADTVEISSIYNPVEK